MLRLSLGVNRLTQSSAARSISTDYVRRIQHRFVGDYSKDLLAL
jgi:hypothetical protein